MSDENESVPRILTDCEPMEAVVYDDLHPCSYLPGRHARTPIRLPFRPLRQQELAERLADGDRRHGLALYRMSCPTCQECQPIRVLASRFVPNRTHRRILRGGDAKLQIQLGPPTVSAERVALYEKHLFERGLRTDDFTPMNARRYRDFLVNSCCSTFEIRYSLEGKLVGIAITDRSSQGLSAHYTFYDPSHAQLSMGTYSILKQLELCSIWDLPYLYLGLYVADNAHMAYKQRFRPHERLIAGKWREFGGDDDRA